MNDVLGLTAFIDVSGGDPARVAEHVATLARHDRLGSGIVRAVVHGAAGTPLPPGWTSSGGAPAEQACGWAFDLAAGDDQPLLIVAAGALPSAEAVSALVEALDLDPLFGIAVPRFSEAGSGRLALHEPYGAGPLTAPRRLLSSVTDYRILGDGIAPCMLVRREVLGNLAFVPAHSLWSALADFGLRARRAGFRTVLCNRAVVTMTGTEPWGCPPEAVARLRHLRGETTTHVPPRDVTRAETLLARAADAPHSLIVDARNLTPVFNGTSAAILGACDALHRARPEASVALWLHPDAAEWHQVSSRFRQWTTLTTPATGCYAAALRLSQPWHASELDSLRDAAAVNVFWMLDTIAWDIGYAAMDDLDETWQRLGTDADGILFISEFSQRRFAQRFPVAPDVHLAPCPLSLDPEDYALPVNDGPPPPFWLVVGNQYDHKHVAPTVDLLARAFPTRNLVVFGDREQPRAARVVRFKSGNVGDAVVRGCYARADVVIFPSFYEGFGLPMIEGLSYGRTVVARDSALVRELAGRYRGPGRLLVFRTERELVDVLARLERGDVTGALPLVATRDADVWDWDAAARCMLQTVDRLVAQAPSPQMLRRTQLARGLWNPHRAPAPPRD